MKLIIFTLIPLILSIGIIPAIPFSDAAEKSLVIDPKSLIHLRDNTYLLIFEGCTGSEPISADEIKIVSDTETLLLVQHAEKGRVIQPDECVVMEVQIKAEDPSSIMFVSEILGISQSIDPENLKKDTLSYGRVDVQMEIPTQISIRTSDLSHSPDPLTHEQIQECENAHNDFATLTSGEFGARYLYHNFVGDCIMLFEDPIWETEGEDRYEMLSQRLMEIKQSLKEQEEMLSKPITIRTLSTIELEQGLYLYTFEGCTGSHSVNVDHTVITSDVEIFSLVSEKREGNVIPPGLCRVLDIKIKADNPDTIRVMIPSMAIENAIGQPMEHGMKEQMKKGPHMSPRAQMKHGTSADEVVCNEGLQLMQKVRDGSAACVSDHAVSKLIERGWGTMTKQTS